jgi:hypothetical protein
MSLEKPLSAACRTFLTESNADIVIGADVVCPTVTLSSSY